jgi:hypothetical protein
MWPQTETLRCLGDVCVWCVVCVVYVWCVWCVWCGVCVCVCVCVCVTTAYTVFVSGEVECPGKSKLASSEPQRGRTQGCRLLLPSP